MSFTLNGYALTHQGNVRGNNEDNYYLFGSFKADTAEDQREESAQVADGTALAAVFDGMGGEDAGEDASLIAARSVRECDLTNIREQADMQLRYTNDLICGEIAKRGCRMGTTAALLYFDQEKAVSVNIGDSRAYLYRGGMLMRLSKDHSEGQRLVDSGIMSEEAARSSSRWHKLTQHLGIFPEELVIEPYFSNPVTLKAGDLYLLCSDGLTDMLSDERIGVIILQHALEGIGCIAERLRDAALAAGGEDNITIVLIGVTKRP